MCRWLTPISSERTAFKRLSSIVRPMAITSPVAFICVDRVLELPSSLSNGKRAILVTTKSSAGSKLAGVFASGISSRCSPTAILADTRAMG